MREQGLRVPQQRRKKRLSGVGVQVGAMCPIGPNVLWALDFQFDTLADGRTIKMLNVIDEFTREALAIRVKRRLNSTDVLETLADLMILRGPPAYVRSDNGPEFIAQALRDWIAAVGSQTAYIEPGSPWENGYCESFNSKLRDELLNGELFFSLAEAQVLIGELGVVLGLFRENPEDYLRLDREREAAKRGFVAQTFLHSPTSRYGTKSRLPLFDTPEYRQIMRDILADVQNGKFAEEWSAEQQAGYPAFKEMDQAFADTLFGQTEREVMEVLGGGGLK